MAAPRKRGTTAPRAPQLLTLKEVGARLGISHDSVERLAVASGLPVVNVGAGTRPRLRVSEDDLAKWIAARTIPAGEAAQ